MEHSPAQMTYVFASLLPPRFPRCPVLIMAILIAVAGASHLLADDQPPLYTVLDGKTFKSQIGPMGQPADVDDLLVFEDGQFVSEECERSCGYSRVEYWVRGQDDAIQMRAEVPCTESGAVMYWRGTVRGDEIEGSFTWINKRWYWTFEKEFWFKGRLVKADSP